jgi:uncharacterized membrane protein
VGILLLMFGLRWLRKAILRASGVLALHDEAQAFAKETESLRRQGGVAAGIDKIAFLTTFKAVVLEGMQVVFIVIALGADGRLLVPDWHWPWWWRLDWSCTGRWPTSRKTHSSSVLA